MAQISNTGSSMTAATIDGRLKPQTAMYVAIGAFAIMAFASFLPWAELGPFSVNGTEGGDGWFSVGLAIAGAGLIWLNRWLIAVVPAVLGAALAVYEVINISTSEVGIFGNFTVGIGVWLLLAASVVAVICIGIFLRKARQAQNASR
jgi:hypothetical protein